MRASWVAVVGAAGLWLTASSCVADDSATVDFHRHVRPLLSDRCFQCHGPDAATRQADLRLDDPTSLARVVAPGKPQESELLRRVLSHDASTVMPPPEINKPLSRSEVDRLRAWIQNGAAWSGHWAYQVPQRWPIPEAGPSRWSTNWIDAFIGAKLSDYGLSPAPVAEAVTLLRRLTFDLTGLPPTQQQLEQWQAPPLDPLTYETAVDELLFSPGFGERLAIYWLDLVRYADSVGYHGDQEHNISAYRDWVIGAFNDGLTFDEMTRHQLAGDLLPNPTLEQRIATGYNRVLQTTHEGGLQPGEYRAIYAADRVRNLSAVWLGATVGCAQCHDHKFDPYTMHDFYSLAAFFADIDDEKHFTAGSNESPTRRDPEIELPTVWQRQRGAELAHELQRLQDELNIADPQQRKATQAQIKHTEKLISELNRQVRSSMITQALAEPRVTRVLPRGNWMDESGPIVEPSFPKFLSTPRPLGSEQLPRLTRLDLANWLVDSEDGIGLLTARVLVNRIWHLLFGQGLASDLGDLGGQGQPPSHPELLDNLAHDLVDHHWDVRSTIRLIVTSQTYRQASSADQQSLERDLGNRWLARQSAFRLPAEMIRDNALAVSGLLVNQFGGPSSRPYQPEGYYRHLNFPQREYQADSTENQWRRGVYMHWQRQFLHPMLRALDATGREECTALRQQSNTPLAALTLLNDPTFVEAARGLAERGWLAVSNTNFSDADHANAQRLKWLFRTVTNREISQPELAELTLLLDTSRNYFQDQPEQATALLGVGIHPRWTDCVADELAAWTQVCRALLNLSELNMRL
ncbi:MAG: PSD1 domain-containing protein [Pirellulaceae bacterium]|nr:PSD1 domain-containing protein [Pirellulaceae bacterium]